MFLITLIAGLVLRLIHPELFAHAWLIGDILLWVTLGLLAVSVFVALLGGGIVAAFGLRDRRSSRKRGR